MSSKTIKPFGSWPGEITAEHVAGKSLRLGCLKAESAHLYWLEQRPEEGGRGVIMSWSAADGLVERLKAPHSANSRVHEYGGGDFCVSEGEIWFVNAVDQQIYHLPKNGAPVQLTDAKGYRFADLVMDRRHNRLIAVAEHHPAQPPSPGEDSQHPLPQNYLVQIGLEGKEKGGFAILAEGADFYASPRISPDGCQLAFLQWHLPHMPWEAACLMVGDLTSPFFTAAPVTDPAIGAAFAPHWRADNQLYFIYEADDFAALHKLEEGKPSKLTPAPEALDCLTPQWNFGLEAITTAPDGSLYYTGCKEGAVTLIHHDGNGDAAPIVIETEARTIDMLQTVRLSDEAGSSFSLAAIVSTRTRPATIALIASAGQNPGKLTPLRPDGEQSFNPAAISQAEVKKFTGPLGQTYGLYYPPQNSLYQGEAGTLPPTILTVHGGPTAMADRGLRLKTQYWTNRGYAVFDVDYAGSSGYGRAYRERLDGRWGIADVEDLIAAAENLIEEQLADPTRLIIEGGSAGGYTALMALVKSDLFCGASVNYPVTDLGQLLKITHKFELGYTYRLTGTTPETAEAALAARSVLAQSAAINSPVIFFQGLSDKVVPPSQPKALYEKLKAAGIQAELHEFEGEGHGFRKAETIKAQLAAQQAFYASCLT